MLIDVGTQGSHIGLEAGPALGQLVEPRRHPRLDLLVEPGSSRLGLLHHGPGPFPGGAHQRVGLGLRLPPGRVGGALGEDQGAAQVLVGTTLEQPSLGLGRPCRALTDASLKLIEGLGHLLDELVDLVGPVPPPLLGEANLTDTLGRHTESHPAMLTNERGGVGDAARDDRVTPVGRGAGR